MGIGKNLMHECIKWCKEKGVEQLELEVVSQNNRAISLYQNLDFDIYGLSKFFYAVSDF